MDWLRTHLGTNQKIVLITQDVKLRPYLYQLVRLEYPHIQVLTRDEVLDTPQEAGDARQ